MRCVIQTTGIAAGNNGRSLSSRPRAIRFELAESFGDDVLKAQAARGALGRHCGSGKGSDPEHALGKPQRQEDGRTNRGRSRGDEAARSQPSTERLRHLDPGPRPLHGRGVDVHSLGLDFPMPTKVTVPSCLRKPRNGNDSNNDQKR